MNTKKNKIVIILGAGFPVLWEAPTSLYIKQAILEILQSHPAGREVMSSE